MSAGRDSLSGARQLPAARLRVNHGRRGSSAKAGGRPPSHRRSLFSPRIRRPRSRDTTILPTTDHENRRAKAGRGPPRGAQKQLRKRGATTTTGRHHSRRAPHRWIRRRRRLRHAWRLVTLSLITAAMVGAGVIAHADGRAHVTLQASPTGFEHLQVNGSPVRVVSAKATAAGWHTPLAARSTTLEPVHPVPPAQNMHISVQVRGTSWFGLLPWSKIVTAVRQSPPDPSLRVAQTTTLVGQPLYVHLNAPAVALAATDPAGGKLPVTRLADDPDIWKVTLNTMGSTDGVMDIATQATPWVAFSLPHSLHWSTVAIGSLLRLQQMLAQLNYLPVQWSPVSSTASSRCRCDLDLNDPPAGHFTWRWSSVPSRLSRLWAPDEDNLITQGAVIAFDRMHGLPVLPYATAAMWQDLVVAWRKHHLDPHAYTYAHVTENLPETLQLWRNGSVVLISRVNTGKPPAHTYIGTFPIHLRFRSQSMRGTGPNGTPYFYPDVPWVNYFHDNEAIHAFPRRAYGFPQSAGCVEMPIAQAKALFDLVHYGTLVTVST